MKSLKLIPLLLTSSFLFACASNVVDVRPGSEKVSVVEKSQVANCVDKGKVTVNVTTKVGLYTRDVGTVEGNLTQLAKNSAAAEGADTVVSGESKVFGERVFGIYQCR